MLLNDRVTLSGSEMFHGQETIKSETTDKETSNVKWKVRLRSFVSFSAVFWVMLLLSINTGPWVLMSKPESTTELLHWIRTLFPAIVLFVSGVFLMAGRDRAKLPGNVRLWLYYGLIGLFTSILSPDPVVAVYFGVAYLAAFAVIKIHLKKDNMVESIVHLNLLSLLTVTVFLLIMIFFAKDILFEETSSGISGYSINVRMPTIVAMPMSIPSGIARFAAVPGVLSFVFIWFGKGWKRFLWLIPLFFFGWIIYIMQSRGAVVGFCFVIAFEMLFLGGKKRIISIFLLLLFGIMLMSDVISGKAFEEVSGYMRRGQSIEDFRSMTGRTYTWKRSWPKIMEAPIAGRGFQADRVIIKEHIHNTYLYVLMTSGFTGGVVFVIGLIWSWLLFFLALRKTASYDTKHKLFLIQAGGILLFFTVRGITEVSGALFNVDFMVMLPIITYLGVLDQKYNLIKKVKVRW